MGNDEINVVDSFEKFKKEPISPINIRIERRKDVLKEAFGDSETGIRIIKAIDDLYQDKQKGAPGKDKKKDPDDELPVEILDAGNGASVKDKKKDKDRNVSRKWKICWELVVIWIMWHVHKGESHFERSDLNEFLKYNNVTTSLVDRYKGKVIKTVFDGVLDCPFGKPGTETDDTWELSEELLLKYGNKTLLTRTSVDEELLSRARDHEKNGNHAEATVYYIRLGEYYNREYGNLLRYSDLYAYGDSLTPPISTYLASSEVSAYEEALRLEPEAGNVFDSLLRICGKNLFDKSSQEGLCLESCRLSSEQKTYLPTVALFIGITRHQIANDRNHNVVEFFKKLCALKSKIYYSCAEFIIKFVQLFFKHNNYDPIEELHSRILVMTLSILKPLPPDVMDFFCFSQIQALTDESYTYDFFGPDYILDEMAEKDFFSYRYRCKDYDQYKSFLYSFRDAAMAAKIDRSQFLQLVDDLKRENISLEHIAGYPGEQEQRIQRALQSGVSVEKIEKFRQSNEYRYAYWDGWLDTAMAILLCGCYYVLGETEKIRTVCRQICPENNRIGDIIESRFCGASLGKLSGGIQGKPFKPLGFGKAKK